MWTKLPIFSLNPPQNKKIKELNVALKLCHTEKDIHHRGHFGCVFLNTRGRGRNLEDLSKEKEV